MSNYTSCVPDQLLNVDKYSMSVSQKSRVRQLIFERFHRIFCFLFVVNLDIEKNWSNFGQSQPV